MALYAIYEGDLIHAEEAKREKIYWCVDCFGSVKKRKGKNGFFHFYHLKAAPSCRLYSKTEDHLLAQLQLQKLFPTLLLERPFHQIHRIADGCLEEEKIVFEIQCSQISEKETKRRIQDYRSLGYEVVWLLDDRRYNRRILKSEEPFLRSCSSYFISIKKNIYYDQFEIFDGNRRVKKGRPLILNLKKIYRFQRPLEDESLLPKQVLQLKSRLYFQNDRLFKAIKKDFSLLEYWKKAELKKSFWPKEKISNLYLAFLRRAVKIKIGMDK